MCHVLYMTTLDQDTFVSTDYLTLNTKTLYFHSGLIFTHGLHAVLWVFCCGGGCCCTRRLNNFPRCSAVLPPPAFDSTTYVLHVLRLPSDATHFPGKGYTVSVHYVGKVTSPKQAPIDWGFARRFSNTIEYPLWLHVVHRTDVCQCTYTKLTVYSLTGSSLPRALLCISLETLNSPLTRVCYVRKLETDHSVFDSSRARHTPFQCKIGLGQLIRGGCLITILFYPDV